MRTPNSLLVVAISSCHLGVHTAATTQSPRLDDLRKQDRQQRDHRCQGKRGGVGDETKCVEAVAQMAGCSRNRFTARRQASSAATVSLDDALLSEGLVDVRLEDGAGLNLGNTTLFILDERAHELENLCGIRTMNDRDAVTVANHDVTRMHDGAAAAHRNVDFTGAIFVAPARRHRAAERGKAECSHAIRVPDGAVHDDAAKSARDGGTAHQLAEHRTRRVAVRGDDDDVARLGHLQGFVHHEVVARARADGDGEPAQG